MDRRHENCKENSSGRQTRNSSQKCYSLATLQRENEKFKNDLKDLQAAHDEKEHLLTERLREIDLLNEENQKLKAIAEKEKIQMRDASNCEKLKNDLKDLQAAHDEKDYLLTERLREIDLLNQENQELKAMAEKEKVQMRDAHSWVSVTTKDRSTWTAVDNVYTLYMKDACTFVRMKTYDKSTSTSVIAVSTDTQVDHMEDASNENSVERDSNSGSISSSVVLDNEIQKECGATCTAPIFDEILLPYNKKADFITFDMNLNDAKLMSSLVSSINASK